MDVILLFIISKWAITIVTFEQYLTILQGLKAALPTEILRTFIKRGLI